jgi:hypothetical protein
MGDVVNLRHVRKAKVRTEREAAAAANRTAFGRSKLDRITSESERRRTETALDGARLTDSPARNSADPAEG